MKVLATAGHVDHGKSTLVRLLTGMEPDRWAEERRRGMTIDLGFGWTSLPDGDQVAFVDVPGHQRFVPNMLAGLGPVPAVLMVVAADQGWARQSSEHLDAIEALQIRHGLLAVTRADLASPSQLAAVLADARDRLAASSLGTVEAVAVSGLTGTGLAELRAAIGRLVSALPAPRTDGRVRLWVDRAFTVKGAGTVLTGTLGAGRLSVGDQLELAGQRYPVRGLQALGSSSDQVAAVARVAVNLRGLDRARVQRGDCLLTPGQWPLTELLDVRLEPLLAEPATELILHIGSASIPARLRRLGELHARLRLARPIPAQIGDRAVLRDPAQQSVVAGALVLDPDPPALIRRGAAAARSGELASITTTGLAAQLRRRGAARRQDLAALGLDLTGAAGVVRQGDWLIDPAAWSRWQAELLRAADEHAAADPRQPRLGAEAARRAIGLVDAGLLPPLAEQAGLDWLDGRLGRPGVRPTAGPAAAAVDALVRRLSDQPFDAPERDELAELGLGPRDLAVAAQAGRLLRIAPELVVAADADQRAVQALAGLAQPFTTSQARQALGTTRRVAVPLLEYLDRAGLTVRLDASRRSLR